MALNITRVDVWVAGIEDRPGGLAEKLAALAEAGASDVRRTDARNGLSRRRSFCHQTWG